MCKKLEQRELSIARIRQAIPLFKQLHWCIQGPQTSVNIRNEYDFFSDEPLLTNVCISCSTSVKQNSQWHENDYHQGHPGDCLVPIPFVSILHHSWLLWN